MQWWTQSEGARCSIAPPAGQTCALHFEWSETYREGGGGTRRPLRWRRSPLLPRCGLPAFPPSLLLLPLKNNIISSKLGFLRSNEIRLKPTLGNTCLDKDRGRVGEGGRWEGAGKLGGAVSLVFLGHKQQQRRVFTGEQTGR